MSEYGKVPHTQAHDQSQLPLVSASSQSTAQNYPSYQQPLQYPSQAKILQNSLLNRGEDSGHSYGQSGPSVLSHTPREGKEGDEFVVSVNYLFEGSANLPDFKITFGYHTCQPTIQSVQGESGQYILTTRVPPFSATQCSSRSLTVSLNVDGTTLEIGQFSYLVPPARQSASQYTSPVSTSLPQSKKRKAEDDYETSKTPVKRQTHQDIRPKKENYSGYYDMGPPATTFQSYSQTPSDNRTFMYSSAYDQSTNSSPIGIDRSTHSTYSFNLPGVSQSSQSSPLVPNPQVSWNTTYRSPPLAPVSAPLSRNIDAISTSVSHGHAPLLARSPSDAANPPLIRTSTLQTGAHQAGRGGFNPYLMPHKAVLNVQGDLDEMAQHWSAEEWENRRRLVQFWRKQNGNTITAQFQAVSAQERHPPNICISCIWWEEKKECYVTSVDCIALLEALIAVRFTVEEKNRIRRNLEGFKPLTVSKGKPESENFFKLIMAFPDPKPRNIEKDVKVFPWKILHEALKKIIGKYSASYSSTAGIITTPSDLPYSSTSTPISSVSSMRRPSLQSNHPISPDIDHRPSLPSIPVSSALTSPNIAHPKIKMHEDDMLSPYSSIPGLPQPIDSAPPMWSQQSMHSRNTSSVSRTSWDMGPYGDSAPSMAHLSQDSHSQLQPSTHLPDLHPDPTSLHRQA